MSNVLFISPCWKDYPILLHSLQMQTYQNWNCLLLHDGKEDAERCREAVAFLNDPRIIYHETDEHHGSWGFAVREIGIEMSKKMTPEFIVHTNSDNYYVPGFCQLMLGQFTPDIQAVWCDCLHNCFNWQYLTAQLAKCQIDAGCVMYRRELAQQVGWKYRHQESDWNIIEEAVALAGQERFVKIPLPLFVHN